MFHTKLRMSNAKLVPEDDLRGDFLAGPNGPREREAWLV
jgi:hypothetical protein